MAIIACSQTDVQDEDDEERALLAKSLYHVALTSKIAKSTMAILLHRSL